MNPFSLFDSLNVGHFVIGVLALLLVASFFVVGLVDLVLAARRLFKSAAGRAQRAPQARSEARPAAPAASGGISQALPDGNHGDNRTSIK